MPDNARQGVIDALAQVVTSLQVDHPTRVAVEGRSAAGKTTFADDLAVTIQLRGREVIRSSIDDFHPPGYKFRSHHDEWTPRSYYAEGYDYIAFRDLLLLPLGPGGNRRCRTALFDSYHDEWLPRHELYEQLDDPRTRAHAVIDNRDLRMPVIQRLTRPR